MSNYVNSIGEWRMDTPPAAGPARSFGESMHQAYMEQVTGWGMQSLEMGLVESETEYLDRMFDLTGVRLDPVLGGGALQNPFMNRAALSVAEHYEEGGDLSPEISERIEEIRKMQEKHPELEGFDSIWARTKERAQLYERRGQQFQDRARRPGSRLGGFMGSVAGLMDPRTDSFNFATLGVGGVGRTFFGRVASEAGFNSIVEATNQFTGVQRNRGLLGLSYGYDQALQQIAFAGAGAAVIRGGVEGIALGARRVTGRKTPAERASDLYKANVEEIKRHVGDSPRAQRAFADEFEQRLTTLEEWSPTPVSRTLLENTTAIREVSTQPQVTSASELLTRQGEATPFTRTDEDPTIEQMYQKAERGIERATKRIDRLEAERARVLAEATGEPEARIQERLDDLERRLNRATPKNRARIEPELREAKARLDEAKKISGTFDRRVERQKGIVDRWQGEIDALDRQRAKQGLPARRKAMDMSGARRASTDPDVTIPRQQQVRVPDTERFIDDIARAEKASDETVENLPQIDEDGMVSLGGQRVSKDTIIETEDGPITLEKMMEEFGEDDALLEAATRCRIGA